MTVEPRTAGLDESVVITITADGDLARLDAIDLPLTNLAIESGPSVSSQFEWINGVTKRHKVFRWIAYAEAPGEASVGPVPLESRQTSVVLPRVSLQVLQDPLAGASSPDEIARRLLESGRDVVFIFPEIDRTDVFVGEQVVITWYLYTAEAIRDLDISSTPSLHAFWIEEIPLTDEPTREVRLAGLSMQRLPIRRVALFPLQSGPVSAGKLVAVAEVMRPIQNRFGVFSTVERRIGRLVLRSPAPELNVQPLPAGTRADAVGRFAMRCSEPSVPAEGPVSFDVTVSGEGNLRSAQQPRFVAPPDARVEVQDRGVSVKRSLGRVMMMRTWRFIFFPRRSGPLEIPAVAFQAWDPEERRGERLTCPGKRVVARAAPVVAPESADADSPPAASPPSARLGLGVFAILLLSVFAILSWRRRRTGSSEMARALLAHAGNPAAMRIALHEILAGRGLSSDDLFGDSSELGETFRALQSLLDIRERETLTADRSPKELERRVLDFGRELDRVKALTKDE